MSVTAKTLAAAVAVSTLVTGIAPATAHDQARQRTRTLTTKVVAPFQLAYHDGRVYVADGATSTVSRLSRAGHLVAVAHGPKRGEVAGVDLNVSGRSLAYTWTNYRTGRTGLTIKTRHHRRVTANLSRYEARRNPDRHRTYGVPASTSQCAKDAIAKLSGEPATYRGKVDSHPYAVASTGHGHWVVADAAGNDLLRVNRRGRISTLAVLPRQPLRITSRLADTLKLPACTVGVTYNFEPVPTDVEVDRHGMLWVTTLPGGPEDPSLGARGSVYRVNPRTGKSHRIATGFQGATNLAVTRTGKVYVTELFGNRISTVRRGHARPFVRLPHALSVEVHGRWLYAGTLAPQDDKGNPMGTGSIVKIRR